MKNSGKRHRSVANRIVSAHIAQLAEHFDTVQIICTNYVPDPEGTSFVVDGTGNWYARYGSVREWIIKEEKGMT